VKHGVLYMAMQITQQTVVQIYNDVMMFEFSVFSCI